MVKIDISSKTNDLLRKEIFRRTGGFKKGVLKSAVEEAIDDWIKKESGNGKRRKEK